MLTGESQIFLAISSEESVSSIREFFILLVSVFLALFGTKAENKIYNRNKALKRMAELNQDVFGLLIIESLEKQHSVEFSLTNGKCYVGYVIKSQLSRHPDSDIALIPIASGYRNKETRELLLTTNYIPVIREFTKSRKIPDDFRIVIRMSEITSVRFFDFDVYDEFKNQMTRP